MSEQVKPLEIESIIDFEKLKAKTNSAVQVLEEVVSNVNKLNAMGIQTTVTTKSTRSFVAWLTEDIEVG